MSVSDQNPQRFQMSRHQMVFIAGLGYFGAVAALLLAKVVELFMRWLETGNGNATNTEIVVFAFLISSSILLTLWATRRKRP